MAVLVEAISVIVRRDAIDRRFNGGWKAFVSRVPNETLCTDGLLARVGFMDPKSVGRFVEDLRADGLEFIRAERCADIVVIDQQRGPTMPCDWVEFARIPFGEAGGKVSAAWLFEGPRAATGIHFPSLKMDFTTPAGWEFEGSLSERFQFVSTDDPGMRYKCLRTDSRIDVFLDQATGKEVFRSKS
jgi:hypothetical protein